MTVPNSSNGPEPLGATEPPITMAVLLRRCSDDVDFALRLLRMFERQLPTLTEAVERAIAAGVAVDVTRSAHAFRGVASTMGASDLSAICQAIEAADVDAARDMLPALRMEVGRCAAYALQAVRGLADAA